MAIYQSDPEAASDAGFVGGELRHAVVGNRGRLLDARRTPLSLTGVNPDRAEFEVRIEGFEDCGARWRLPLWEIGRLQFAAGSRETSSDIQARLERAVSRFDHELVIPADASALPQTRRRIARERAAIRDRLAELRGAVLWEMLAIQRPTLYRAAAADGPLPPRRPTSLISCTFSEEVAAAHFAGGETTQSAVIWRQLVDPDRLLLTFLETAAMNERFHEAEAVLIGGGSELAF